MFNARVSYNQDWVMIWVVIKDNDTDIDYWYEAQDIVNILSDQIRNNGKPITRNKRGRKPSAFHTKKCASRVWDKTVSKVKSKTPSKVVRNKRK